MRVAAVLLLCAVCAVVVGAGVSGCSSSTPAAATMADAGDEFRPLGESCDPASPHPCEVLTDGCSAAVCQSKVCVRVFLDAGPTCSNGSPPPYDAGAEDAGQGSDASLADAGDAATIPGDAASDASDAAATDASFDASVDAAGD